MWIRVLAIGLALAGFSISPNGASAQPMGYRVGAGIEDITPQTAIRLTGYGNRQTESSGVEHKLFARALAIRSEESAPPAVICTVEILGITPEIRRRVLEEVNKSTPLANERFALCATHTHTGPCVNGVCPLILGDTIKPEEQQRIDRYTEELAPKISKAIVHALTNMQEAQVSLARGRVDFAVNRRLLKDGIWSGFGVVPDGPVDHQLPLLAAKDKNGKVIAVLANYACHCTTFGGNFNRIAGDWAGYASSAIEKAHPGSVALITIGCGADANPNPRDGDNVIALARQHGENFAREVERLLAGEMKLLSGSIEGKFTTIKLPFDRPRTEDEWKSLAKQPNQTGVYGKYFLEKFQQKAVPEELDYAVATLTFGDELAMVFLAGEVVVDYSIRLHDEFLPDRLWVTAYANNVPCYIPSRRILREQGYEADRSMEFYRQPNRFSPVIEDLIADTVQKLLPQTFYSKEMQAEFPPPKSPKDALASFKLPKGLKVELVASEPLIQDPVAFDWGMDGSLWVAQMGDYPNGLDGHGKPGGCVKHLTDANADGVYDHAETFLKDLPFPTGIKVWREGVLITAAPKILYAEDTDSDGVADKVETLYEGFGEGNQQHRVNGLRFGLDNWLYVGNGDSGGKVRSLKTGEVVETRGRDLRIQPDLGLIETVSGSTQFGIERDDWGNWFGGNNSNPMWQYVLDQRYLDRNPYVVPPDARVMVSELPGNAPVYPISRTLGRFNDFHTANRFTSACSPMIYRDDLLGKEYAGNAFVCEPVHNLVHREVVTQDGVRFKSQRAASEQTSEFFASDDNWFRPVMVRTGPDGGLWIADFYRFVIEHPQWIPEHQQRKVDLRAGSDRGRIYRIVPESGARPVPNLNKLSTDKLVKVLESPSGTLRDMAHQLLLWKNDESSIAQLEEIIRSSKVAQAKLHGMWILYGLADYGREFNDHAIFPAYYDHDPRVVRHALRIVAMLVQNVPEGKKRSVWPDSGPVIDDWNQFAETSDPLLKMQTAYVLGNWKSRSSGKGLGHILTTANDDPYLIAAAISSLHEHNLETVTDIVLKDLKDKTVPAYILPLLQTALGHKRGDLVGRILLAFLPQADSISARELQLAQTLLGGLSSQRSAINGFLKNQAALKDRLEQYNTAARALALNEDANTNDRGLAIRFLGLGFGESSESLPKLEGLIRLTTPAEVQVAAVEALSQLGGDSSFKSLLQSWQSLTPAVKKVVMAGTERNPARLKLLLAAVEHGTIAATELDVSLRQRLLDHPNPDLRTLARQVLGESASRKEILGARESALAVAGDVDRGKPVFEKHCSQCHKVGETGYAVGPDLASLTNRSPQALFLAILDPNAALEDKYAQYVAITTEGVTHNGQLVNETANAITLEAAESKRVELLRSDLEAFRSTGKSLMPEGMEKVLSDQNLADLLAYVGEIGPEPKAFTGLKPRTISQEDDAIRLPASAAYLYGDLISFQPKYEVLETWGSPTDRAAWKFQVAKPGKYKVELEYACDPLHSGNKFRLSAGNQSLEGSAESTGSWDHFTVHALGTIDLAAGPTRIQMQSIGPIRRESLMKLRSLVLRLE